MKNVRKDVIAKLERGFEIAKADAAVHGLSTPKSWSYSTGRAWHWISEDEEGIYFNSEYYDGARAHSEKMKGDKRK